jgi:hypothetical protein
MGWYEWSIVYGGGVSFGERERERERGRTKLGRYERRRSSGKGKAGEYAVKRRLTVQGSVTKMGTCDMSYETSIVDTRPMNKTCTTGVIEMRRE